VQRVAGSCETIATGRKGISAFRSSQEFSGFRVGGMRTIWAAVVASVEILLNDCVVPAENPLGIGPWVEMRLERRWMAVALGLAAAGGRLGARLAGETVNYAKQRRLLQEY